VTRLRKIALWTVGFAVCSPLLAHARTMQEWQGDKQVYYRAHSVQAKEESLPQGVQALDARAIEEIKARKFKQAIATLTESLKLYPKNAGALANRAHCYRAVGAFDEALADYRKAESIAPDIAPLINKLVGEMYLARGRARIDQGDIKGASADLAQAAKEPATKAQALSEFSYIAMMSKDFPACIDMAERSERADPKFTDPRINKGVCLFASGKYRESIASLNSAIRIDPKVTAAYLNLIPAHIQVHDCAAAKQDAARAIALEPSSAQVANRLVAACQ
jgi:tetratricopeptide (TPR) repeat protein